jgi:hypothetical protein
MGDVFKKIKRLIATVLIVIAIVLVAIALIYWGQPDLVGTLVDSTGAVAIFGTGITSTLAGMSPLGLSLLAGAIGAIAYIVDEEGASAAVTKFADMTGDFAGGLAGVGRDIVDAVIPRWVQYTALGIGAYALYNMYVKEDEITIRTE